MDYIKEFLILYFPLLTIIVGMTFIGLYNFKTRKRETILIFVVLSVVFLLAVLLTLEEFARDYGYLYLALICSVLGYTIRPSVIILFIALGDGEDKKYQFFLFIPIGLTLLIYSSSFFINTDLGHIAFYYNRLSDGSLEYVHGTTFLNYTSHIVSGGLLAFLLYNTIKKVRVRQSPDTFALFGVAFFIIAAVLIEMFTSRTGLLNNTIGITTVFYYLFIYSIYTRKDALTGLADRKSYYADEQRFSKDINGYILIDMNGLKMLNDKFGHDEGDKGIVAIANAINSSIKRNMYSYRMGGDEFVILCMNTNKEEIEKVIETIRGKLKPTIYSASFGYSIKDPDNPTLKEMSNTAELVMYSDKDYYYKSNHIDRRRK